MSKILSIAKRDFRAYFTSPVAYVVIGLFMAVTGYMFFSILSSFNMANLQYQQTRMGRPMSISDGIVMPLMGNINVMLLFITPVISMRLFAEEKRQHTMELLMTSPVTLWQMVWGKFLSAFWFMLVMLALTLVYPAILFATGNPDPGPIASSYLGTVFLMSSYLSIGLFFSALTEHQIIAVLCTFIVSLFFWLVAWAAQYSGPVLSEVFQYLSLINHFGNFAKGLINSSDIVFYLSFIGTGLFLTHRTLDSYRWR